jgi:aerobic-type carbon monoxide dehydrogenase small subunit (CoxS/CutS family)
MSQEDGIGNVELTLNLNGRSRRAPIDPRMLLIDALRESFQATGPKIGCLNGDCGACTVKVDDQIVKSCLELALAADGASVRTIEGLAENGELTQVQQAFWDLQAFQCGFCLSGMLFSAEDLLECNPHPTESEIREAISGNLCRCTGYQHIVDAIASVAVKDG